MLSLAKPLSLDTGPFLLLLLFLLLFLLLLLLLRLRLPNAAGVNLEDLALPRLRDKLGRSVLASARVCCWPSGRDTSGRGPRGVEVPGHVIIVASLREEARKGPCHGERRFVRTREQTVVERCFRTISGTASVHVGSLKSQDKVQESRSKNLKTGMCEAKALPLPHRQWSPLRSVARDSRSCREPLQPDLDLIFEIFSTGMWVADL